MKRAIIVICALLILFFLSACGNSKQDENRLDTKIDTDTTQLESITQSENNDNMQIQIHTKDNQTIIFQMNDSLAAKAFYEQLPLSVWVEEYAKSEKIFYPPEKLDTNDTPMAEGSAGTLAYYAPWGNVAIFYEECKGANGLYELGEVVSGKEYLAEMTGEIDIEKVINEKKENTSEDKETEAGTSITDSSNGETASNNPVENNTTVMPQQPETEQERNQLVQPESQTQPNISPQPDEKEESEYMLNIQIGEHLLTATLVQNSSTEALIEMLSAGAITINMRDYANMEKVGAFPASLPRNDEQISTEVGDLILYQGNSFVIYYDTNSWNFTRLGRINHITQQELKEILGDGNVTVELSLSTKS